MRNVGDGEDVGARALEEHERYGSCGCGLWRARLVRWGFVGGGRFGTYCPGDGIRGADWDDVAAIGKGDGVSTGIATTGHGDGGRKTGEGRGEREDGEVHFG